MLNVMAGQPNIGGTLCESSVISFLVPCYKLWLMAAAWVPCSNAVDIGKRKTGRWSESCTGQNSVRGPRAPENAYIVYQPRRRPNIMQSCLEETHSNLLGCPKQPKRSQPPVGQSLPYCQDTWKRYCCLTTFFPIVNMCLSCKDIAEQSCAVVPRWQFFCVLYFEWAACSTFQTCILNLH